MSRPEADEATRENRDDNDWAAAAAHGLHTAAYVAVQQPYDSLKQLGEKTIGIGLPDAQFVSRPENARPGTAAWGAEALGGGIGMLPELYVLHRATQMAFNKAGWTPGNLGLSRAGTIGLAAAEAGVTGGAYGLLFEPVSNENFFGEKAKSIGVTAGTFAAMGGMFSGLRPMTPFADSTSMALRRAGNATFGGTVGFGGGLFNAGMNDLVGREHDGYFYSGIKFATLGTIIGGIGRPETQTRVMEEQAKGARTTEAMYDGAFLRPEQVAPMVEGTKAQFGATSPEHAAALMRYADAHMAQGAQGNPMALESYAKALEIYRSRNPESPETAWALDRVSAAKQSSGDAAGSITALGEAVRIWNKLAEQGQKVVDDFYRGRRQEDLERMRTFVERTTR